MLSKLGDIKGRIVDHVGTPISGASVKLQKYSNELETVLTKLDGSYNFSDVIPSGSIHGYSILVSAEGYSNGGSNDWVSVRSGLTTTVDLTLNKLSTITGRVVDDLGSPISGASITLDGIYNNLDKYGITTDKYGYYSIPNVYTSDYSYKIIASAPYHVKNIISDVVVSEFGTTISNMNLSLDRYGVISGQVTDATGSPLYSWISFISNGQSIDYDQTDSQGYYSVTVPPGTYTMKIGTISYDDQFKIITVEKGQSVTLNIQFGVVDQNGDGIIDLYDIVSVSKTNPSIISEYIKRYGQ
ncbi:carboxypeptidase-like regulatory domain-containing protein [Ammoniphilus sp. 3BR4]|uniref:carboxypeptidase-like regulatory domain-containing protein n=1 Tax=Ammoniphilus sp. 3BR4 TaxID=3158265 RepID=UPI0034660A28